MKAILIIFLCATMLVSCGGAAPKEEVRRVDSLNSEAYDLRYKDLEASCAAATAAYDEAKHYKLGKAVAANGLGFCAFMRMDFAEAERCHKEVYDLTKNEVELLIADIGLMKICQRMALNKEFYDYRNRALNRMKRIAEEGEDYKLQITNYKLQDADCRIDRLGYARSEFHIVSAIYYYYLQQRPQAVASINEVVEDGLAADSSQWLCYHYIKGSAALCEGETRDEQRMREFDQLFITWREAAQKGYLYFEANALQGLANLMVSPQDYDFFQERRFYALKQLDDAPLGIAQEALQKFKEYGDGYQVASAYVTIGKYLNLQGQYEEALDTLQLALGSARDAIPECVSRIREQMSVSYAGLGMKQESDQNRNIYLDILDDTRQDKEWESRYQALEKEGRQQSILLALVVAGFVILVILFAIFNRLSKKRSEVHLQQLQQLLDISEQHIAANKRQNLIKKTCMSIVNGIQPYIDRILKSLDGAGERSERIQYIDELVTTINEHNDILTQWIKMKQGGISLNVENFELNELFELIRKGGRAFEMKKQTLEVQSTELRVKADKALTLFMINTLAENARKYTPQGGQVKVYATEGENYVEISVQDNGCGLSEKDVKRIMGEKVYDSTTIGMDDAADKEELRKNKGSGFGLMNCKGIIEKYRKSSQIFKVCRFYIESRLGEGSRFLFRLPKATLVLVFALGMSACSLSPTAPLNPTKGGTQEVSSQKSVVSSKSSPLEGVEGATVERLESQEYTALLDSASDYANQAYFCNVDGEYEQALAYIDSARTCLNEHHVLYAENPQRLMTLTGEGTAAELEWWEQQFNSDYHVILDIRNEAAVAFLALRSWDEYSYNNAAYTMLYKLLGEDKTLEAYCRQLERSTGYKAVGIVLAVILLLVLPFLLYAFYFLRSKKYRELEATEEAARRSAWEESVLHVQNMVLDNCLSTIKHETVYYPNKVKLLIGKLRMSRLTEEEQQETMTAISELMEYYKGIFTILSSCASRQLEEVTFRRSVIPVQELLTYAENYFEKKKEYKSLNLLVGTHPGASYGLTNSEEGSKTEVRTHQGASLQSNKPFEGKVTGDRTLLRLLLESLIDEACTVPFAGTLTLTAEADGEFVRFRFTDHRRKKSQEELNQLFHPHRDRLEYMICRQVIREHDEYGALRGCRINAEPCEEGGFTVYFTVPRGK